MDLERALELIVEAIDPSLTLTGHHKLSGGLSYQLRRLATSGGDLVLREASDLRAGRWGLQLADEFALVLALGPTPVPAPAPRLFDDSGTVLKHPFAVYDFVPGEPMVTSDDAAATGRLVADALAIVHATDLDAVPRESLPQWSEFAGSVVMSDRTAFDDDTSEELVRSTLSRHWPPTTSGPDRLLHGDFWPANLITDGHDVIGVLDWENAAIGPVEADLAVTRLDLLWCFGAQATSAFTSRYAEHHPIDRHALAVWDLFAALRPAGDLHEWAAGYPDIGRPDITFDSMRLGHRWFVTQALAACAE